MYTPNSTIRPRHRFYYRSSSQSLLNDAVRSLVRVLHADRRVVETYVRVYSSLLIARISLNVLSLARGAETANTFDGK